MNGHKVNWYWVLLCFVVITALLIPIAKFTWFVIAEELLAGTVEHGKVKAVMTWFTAFKISVIFSTTSVIVSFFYWTLKLTFLGTEMSIIEEIKRSFL